MRFWPSARRDRAPMASGLARRNHRLTLRTRVGLVLTGLAASLLLVLGGLWLHGTRNSIHEEVEAASRVSEQWLKVVVGDLHALPASQRSERLLGVARAIGRIRANELEVHSPDGSLLYVSPAPTYKAGRAAPAWFARLLSADLPVRTMSVGEFRLSLRPDDSRAVLDAWDELLALAGWALALLVCLFVAACGALARALRPLDQIMRALDRTGRGRFDTRLPQFATPELGRISRAFNGMADRLSAAVDENVRLDTEREVVERMQAGLQAERQVIARELHDELAQGITAVRALAGAIVQRTPDEPALHIPAQSIVAVTGEMQDGVRNILHRLRPPVGSSLVVALDRHLGNWRLQHPEIELLSHLAIADRPVADDLAATVLRCVQEGLTNVVRHAAASRVELHLFREAGWLHLSLADNGRGQVEKSTNAGCGLGLTGMAERISAIGGHLRFSSPLGQGFCIDVRLPDVHIHHLQEEFA